MPIIDLIILIIFLAGTALLIFTTRRSKSFKDFSLGFQNIPFPLIFASMAATFIGPGYSMGLINKAGSDGYIWLIVFTAFSIQTIIIGVFVAPRLREFSGAYTLGDIMGTRYGKLVKLMSGFLSAALCMGFIGAIAKASGDIIHYLTGFPLLWAIILSTTLVVVYSTYGGIKTVVQTDSLQFIVLAISVPIILAILLGDIGSKNVSELVLKSFANNSSNLDGMTILGLILSFFLGESLIPPYTTRALISSNSVEAKRTFITAGIFGFFWFIVCSSIGVLGSSLFPDTENLFLELIIQYVPIGLKGIIIAAFVGIIMSSQDSLLNSASVTFNRDIAGLLISRHQNKLKLTKWFSVILGILAIYFALRVPSVVDALLYCYTLWAPTIVLPLVIAVLYPKAHAYAAFAAIVAGALATTIWQWGFSEPFGILSILVGVVANQIFFWSAQLVFKGTTSKYSIFQPIKTSKP